ncbi:proline dehydrogenase family protein [Flaviflexus equikiangi]|uniref:L-glutamate gamma-semialdehyde dehydrogenase n=1 Tax=Flaviflexus equikiangi TaxID=2758573 RepID=A0ABS2TGP6_9ACTO|nr:proline dehydrogenase family protein [Flaviflexus equikiangi]MBM9432962.1 proline dehydrogenase family protein [Flaviflexus equikiangi]
MDIVTRAIAKAQEWSDNARAYSTPYASRLLSQVLDHPGGLDYTVNFVDGVIRPEDSHVVADNLSAISQKDASFLPPYLGILAKGGGKLAPLLPGVATEVAEKIFAALVGDLVVDVTPSKLGPAISKLRADGSRLNLNLLGEAVLGDGEAERRLAATTELIRRDDVDYVSLKVSSVIGPHAPYGFDEAVDHAVAQLLPVFRVARDSKTFINLDMEEYKDLHLTIAVFKTILDDPEFTDYRSGIVLQSYLPDGEAALADLTEWAKARRARGGAPIKVRIVKGANLSMERVDAVMHGWELAVQPSKEATDANYLVMLDQALTKENIDAVHIGIAGQNLFTLAYGVLLCRDRGLAIGTEVDVEMLAGMATPQAHAVRDDIGSLLYYVPVVKPEEYDVAISYLVRRLEENATPENFMSNVFALEDSSVFGLEAERFSTAYELAQSGIDHGPRRIQDRNEAPEAFPREFSNTPDTDPSLPANIAWAKGIAARIPTSELGSDIVRAHTQTTIAELDEALSTAVAAGKAWSAKPAGERADILLKVAHVFEANRGRLIEVAGSEAGKTIDQADVEVSEAIDFARYYASLAPALDNLEGARFTPVETTLITPPWNFPIAIPAGGVLAALATGSGVLFKPARLTRRIGSLVADLMWEAGVPRDVLQLVNLDGSDRNLGQYLVERVDQVILTGSIETARRFRSWRPDLRVFAETSGKNAIIVTPHADIDLAVKDVVYSAFGHAGQKCSAASLVILVGSVGFSRRFHDQLVDAVKSLNVGYPADLSTEMGPLTEVPSGKLLRGLTKLEPGQSWVVKPRKLSDNLWTPGVRSGVQPGSEYHLTEYFGPILGVMRADSLVEAVEWQNAVEFGLTAGIHSLDAAEIAYWLDHVHAGNAYVNRGITGAIVQRQPFGGWKRSSVGTGTKAGGPNYLYGLGHVTPAFTGTYAQTLNDPILRKAKTVAESLEDAERTQEILSGMDRALAEEFHGEHDPSQLGVEINILRYVGFPRVVFRLGADAPVGDLLASVAGAVSLGANVEVSSAGTLAAAVAQFMADHEVLVTVESTEQWQRRAKGMSVSADGVRFRVLGEDASALAAAIDGSVDVGIYADPITPAGRVELLPYVQEQAISATNHRFGNHTSLLKGVLI